MTTNAERRRHARIPFDTHGTLYGSQGEVSVRIMDISFRGVLVQTPSGWAGPDDADYRIDLPLSEQALISMEARLARRDGNQAAFRCTHIDIDSMAHLRRLLELNMGDEMLLRRELVELGR